MQALNSILEEETKMYKTGNEIAPARRAELNKPMNQSLASAVDLQMRIKQAAK